MAQEDREAYIAWLRDEVGWYCNSRGCYEAFWDYDDSVTPDQMAEACANYEEAGFASPPMSPSWRNPASSGPWRTS